MRGKGYTRIHEDLQDAPASIRYAQLIPSEQDSHPVF
jgi:hypothetical protein